jgi:hypothetical protein
MCLDLTTPSLTILQRFDQPPPVLIALSQFPVVNAFVRFFSYSRSMPTRYFTTSDSCNMMLCFLGAFGLLSVCRNRKD